MCTAWDVEPELKGAGAREVRIHEDDERDARRGRDGKSGDLGQGSRRFC